MVDPMAYQKAHQAMMTNQMNAQMTSLAQFAQQNLQAPMSDLQNVFALSASRQTASAVIVIDAKERAELYAERGEELIGRIAFWMVLASLPIIGWLADRTLARLASQLDAVTDDVERWADMAAKRNQTRP